MASCAILGVHDESGRVAIQHEAVGIAVEYDSRRAGRYIRTGRWCDRDDKRRSFGRVRHRVDSVDCRRAGVIVVDPEWAPRPERNAPRVYQVRVLNLRVEMTRLIVGHQVGLAEQLVLGMHVEAEDRIRRIQERHGRRAEGIGRNRRLCQVTHLIAPRRLMASNR